MDDDLPIRVLLVDDDEDDCLLVRDALREIPLQRYDVTWAPTYEAGLDRIAAGGFDVCLVDYRLGARSGLDLLREALARGCRAPIVLLTGQGDRSVDVQAMEAGAADFLVKGQIPPILLERAIRYAIERQENIEALRDGNRRLEDAFRRLRENQVQIVQSARMVSVGQLAAGVAHELNNPLTTILGFAQSAMRRLPKDDPLAFPLASIERESLRCKALIQDLLTFSRQSAATVASFDVDSLLNATILLVKGRAIAQSVEIRLEAPDAPLLVDGAPPQIQQVLINLCHNALDAMPSGGTLTLRAGPVEDGGERFARIEVLDTGTGIPPEIRDRVFEPFFTTKEPGQGTGIGLSIAYEIVRQHQGRISFESEVGRGTRFQVLLPAAAPLTPQETRHESPSQDPGRR